MQMISHEPKGKAEAVRNSPVVSKTFFQPCHVRINKQPQLNTVCDHTAEEIQKFKKAYCKRYIIWVCHWNKDEYTEGDKRLKGDSLSKANYLASTSQNALQLDFSQKPTFSLFSLLRAPMDAIIESLGPPWQLPTLTVCSHQLPRS